MSKAQINTALIALGAFAVVALVQSKVAIPFIGTYLPKANA